MIDRLLHLYKLNLNVSNDIHDIIQRIVEKKNHFKSNILLELLNSLNENH